MRRLWEDNKTLIKYLGLIACAAVLIVATVAAYGGIRQPGQQAPPSSPGVTAQQADWSSQCTIQNPDVSTSFYDPLYTVTLTNNSGSAQSVLSADVAFMDASGNQVDSRSVDIGKDFMAGATLSTQDDVPSALETPEPGRDWNVATVPSCQVIDVNASEGGQP